MEVTTSTSAPQKTSAVITIVEKKQHTLLLDSFDINPASKKSKDKAVHLQGTGPVAVVPVQLKNGEKTLNTYAYLDNGSC